MRQFESLRITPWYPTFTWVETAHEAADRINSFHEDYPQRVEITQVLLELPFKLWGVPERVNTQEIQTLALGSLHWFLFNDTHHAGKLREVNVRVGLHHPPHWNLLPMLMFQLEQAYLGKLHTVEDLQHWYSDFETIHPFQDGNGRVGGLIVAAFAHAKEPEKGWLAADQ